MSSLGLGSLLCRVIDPKTVSLSGTLGNFHLSGKSQGISETFGCGNHD